MQCSNNYVGAYAELVALSNPVQNSIENKYHWLAGEKQGHMDTIYKLISTVHWAKK